MLQGTLQEFSLPDVFQLLTLTRKSGSLLIHGGGRRGRVAFHRGEVSFAVSDVRRMPLGARLVGAGLVSDEQLGEVLAAHRGGGSAALSKALLEAETVDQDTLHTFLREQIQDSVSTLMRLEDGSFAFEAADAVDDGGVTMATDELIAEGERRIAEWATIRESLPSLDGVLGMCPAPSTGDRQLSITAPEWQLLTLVDGKRRVRDVVELTGMGEHATCQVLDGLVRKGLVEAFDPAAGETGALAKVLARRDALRRLEQSELGAEPPAPPTPPMAPASTSSPTPDPTPDGHAPARSSRINVPSAEALLAQVGPDPEPSNPAQAAADVAAETDAQEATESMESTDSAADTEAPGATEAQDSADPGDAHDGGDPAAGPGGTEAMREAPVPAGGSGSVDRAQVARELASLGLAQGVPQRARAGAAPAALPDAEAAPTRSAAPAGPAPAAHRPLTRDEDVNKGLLLRLIDGVKGA